LKTCWVDVRGFIIGVQVASDKNAGEKKGERRERSAEHADSEEIRENQVTTV
jgi:hypothetical protein